MTSEDIAEKWRMRTTGCRRSGGCVVRLSGLAAENDFHRRRLIAQGQNCIHLVEHLGGQIDVVGPAGVLVVEMRVRPQVWAVSGRAAFKVHRADEVAVSKRLKAVLDGGERHGRTVGCNGGKRAITRGRAG